MGQQTSSASKNFNETISIEDTISFRQRLSTILENPVYEAGLDVNSVLEMMDDIVNVYHNGKRNVRIPVPMKGNAPLHHIHFTIPRRCIGTERVVVPGLKYAQFKSRRAVSRSISAYGSPESIQHNCVEYDATIDGATRVVDEWINTSSKKSEIVVQQF